MKALIVSNLTRKFQAGHYSMIQPLIDLGYEVHWAANLNELHDETEELNFQLHHIDFDRNPFKPINIQAYKQLYKLVKEEKFDVLHCQSPIGGVLGRLVGHQLKVRKVIYTAHGLHFYKGAPLINRIIYKSVEKSLGKFSDAIIVMNNEDFNSVKEIKLKNNLDNYYLIHGIGVSLKDISPAVDKEEHDLNLPFKRNDNSKIVISMGDLIKRKDYETSIKAFSNFLDKNEEKDIHYIICGTGPEESMLKALVRNLNKEKNIHFLGFRNDVENLLKISDVFLFSTIQEGMPRALMEAMNASLICIVSDIRGNNDLILNNQGGFLFEKKNVNELTEKLLFVFSNEFNNQKEFINQNLDTLKKYDVENVKVEMKNIYSKIL